MRLLLASLAVLLLACALAHADEIADEADVLRVQLAEARAEALEAQIEAARRELLERRLAVRLEREKLQHKYKLAEGDQVDPSTRKIVRAPKPAKESKK